MSTTLRHYILVWRDTSMHLVGPFDTFDALCAWAHDNWRDDASHVGDPRWQTVALTDAAVSQPVPVQPPEVGVI